jgi:hypothetical protein
MCSPEIAITAGTYTSVLSGLRRTAAEAADNLIPRQSWHAHTVSAAAIGRAGEHFEVLGLVRFAQVPHPRKRLGRALHSG